MFYTSVHRHKNSILVRGYKDGQRYQDKVAYEPYVFVTTRKETPYRTLFGQPVEKVTFDSMYDARDYTKRYEDVHGFDIYGLTNYVYPYIRDEFPGEIEYDPDLLSITNLDIEVEVDESSGFPNVLNPQQRVNAITLYSRGTYYTFGMGDYDNDEEDVIYTKCADEHTLLSRFVTLWDSLDIDVVTGWNCEGFDIPYLVNRIKRICGEETALRLSPWRLLEERTFEAFGKEQIVYTPVGLSVIDYLQLYKKFSYTPQESYRLDHIANYELGIGKLDYSEYDSLFDLYRKNHQKFIKYNITDVRRVVQLDEKLKFIEMVLALAYNGKVNFLDTFTSVKMWDVIIHNYLLDRNIVVEPHKRQERERQIAGGHVKSPQIGMHKWVVSFDLNSLYPHLIMQYNIGPDTIRDYAADVTVDSILEGAFSQEKLREYMNEHDVAIAATGWSFTRSFKGFLAQLMSQMYDDRAKYKKLMLEAKQEVERIEAEIKLKGEVHELKVRLKQATNSVAKYKNFQQAKKIQLNSVYGAMGNPGFRWYDPRYAESITLSGQLSIRWMENKLNKYLNKVNGTENVDYIIAIDTDSMYLNMDKFVEKFMPGRPTKEIVAWLDKVCAQKLEPLIDSYYDELAVYVNAYEQKMKMKREAIADKGIWTGKKHYILNVYNNEGVSYEEPELKIMGIEAVRSSTPSACRDNIKKALRVIMDRTEEETLQFIENFRAEFSKLPFEEVAFPRSVSDIEKWQGIGKEQYKKGTPIQVKASIVYNRMIEEKGIANRYRKINSGEKIKFAYLRMPNPARDTVVAAPEQLPEALGLNDYIDYNTQFDKSFIEPLRSILDAVGWKVERRGTLDEFFS